MKRRRFIPSVALALAAATIGRRAHPAAAADAPGREAETPVPGAGAAAPANPRPPGAGPATGRNARRPGGAAGEVVYPAVVPGRPLAFPRDHGAHPDFRTEWWYVTGWLQPARGARASDAGTRFGADAFGFQITFFRTRLPHATANPSAFTPSQVLIAHAALAEARRGRLVHDQRVARAGFGLVSAGEATTRVRLDDWRFSLEGDTYVATIPAREFDLVLRFAASRPPLLQGDSGYSRKGRLPEQASYYYSRAHLAARGRVSRDGSGAEVSGVAWLDHEWSSEYMDGGAVGWDWIGINLDDGALMAFRMRGRDGAVRWAAATLAGAGGTRTYAPAEVSFEPLRTWRSPRSGAAYPVAMTVRCGEQSWQLEPLMDDQELDARASAGAVYWEGAVRAVQGGRVVGRGYLELVGYYAAMKL